MKQTKTILTAAALALLALLAGCSRTDFAAKIAGYYQKNGNPTQNVKILETLQSYPDSFRSPNDTGKSTKIRARITWANGQVTEGQFEVFVADSDGWTMVKQ